MLLKMHESLVESNDSPLDALSEIKGNLDGLQNSRHTNVVEMEINQCCVWEKGWENSGHKRSQNHAEWPMGREEGEANKKDFCEGRGHCHLQTIRSKITGPLKSHLDAKQH